MEERLVFFTISFFAIVVAHGEAMILSYILGVAILLGKRLISQSFWDQLITQYRVERKKGC